MISILLVDDHALMRQSLRALLSAEEDMTIIGEAGHGREAIELVAESLPDVVLMDVSMPQMNGIEATRQIKARFPEVKVVVLSMYSNEEYVVQMLQAGVSGYVLKAADSAEVVVAIRAAMADETFLSTPISRKVIQDYIQRVKERDKGDDFDLLTQREREVLQLLAEGASTQEIADQLHISTKTVETHRGNMMLKLGTANKTDLVKYAYRKGWAFWES